MEKWWNEICGRGKREKPREQAIQIPFRPPRNPHGGPKKCYTKQNTDRSILNFTCKRNNTSAFSLYMIMTRMDDKFNQRFPGLCGSPGELSEELVTWEKRKKSWRMNCDIGETTEGLENEL